MRHAKCFEISPLPYRSVVVLCKNMSSSDIKEILPAQQLNPCKNLQLEEDSPASKSCKKFRDLQAFVTDNTASCQNYTLQDSATCQRTNCTRQEFQCTLLKKVKRYLVHKLIKKRKRIQQDSVPSATVSGDARKCILFNLIR